MFQIVIQLIIVCFAQLLFLKFAEEALLAFLIGARVFTVSKSKQLAKGGVHASHELIHFHERAVVSCPSEYILLNSY